MSGVRTSCALRTAVSFYCIFRIHVQKCNCSRKQHTFWFLMKFLFTKQLKFICGQEKMCLAVQCTSFYLQWLVSKVTLQKDHNDRYIISTTLFDRRVHLIKPNRQIQRIISEKCLFMIQRTHHCGWNNTELQHKIQVQIKRTSMRAASSNGPSRRYRSSNRSAASWSENTSHTPSQAKINMGHSPH